MNEMIERVARVICRALGRDPDEMYDGGWGPESGAGYPWWTHYEPLARSAIASMREPTEEMIGDSMTHFDSHRNDDSAAIWRAMIDIALKDTNPP